MAAYYMPHLIIVLSSLNKHHNRANRDKLPMILIAMLLLFDIGWVSYFNRISLTVIVACGYMLLQYQREDFEDGSISDAS